MNQLIFVGIVLLFVIILDSIYALHDEKILNLMRNGEGPDVYTTFSGETYVNTQKLIKKKFQTQGS